MIARAMMAGKPWDAFDAGMDADACFVHPHHPDRLGIPEPRPGRVRADRMRSALAWNVFRTLAPIDPSRWLRPLHARVFGFDQRYVAPQWLDVRVWAAVPAAGGAGAAGCVDVLCTSGDAVWAFLTTFERDVIVTAADASTDDPIVRTVAAASRQAGRGAASSGCCPRARRARPSASGWSAAMPRRRPGYATACRRTSRPRTSAASVSAPGTPARRCWPAARPHPRSAIPSGNRRGDACAGFRAAASRPTASSRDRPIRSTARLIASYGWSPPAVNRATP